MTFDKTKKLSPQEAKKLAIYVLEHGEIIISDHAKYERMPERGYDDPDIYNILEKGKVSKPEWDEDRNRWNYRFTGEDLEGVEGTIVGTFYAYNGVLVITVF